MRRYQDLERNPELAVALCRASHGRLVERIADLTDDLVARPSRLPGWTVGHVLSHLARNADAHSRRLIGALNGRDVAKYPGGEAQRRAEIDDGARQSASHLICELAASQHLLELALNACADAAWPHGHSRGGTTYPLTGCAAHRLREVEMHHVDLGLGYGPSDWPEEYVVWDLTNLLNTVPERIKSPEERRTIMAWLAGRGLLVDAGQLAPW